jgi:hyperosmotically inducible periplasmic protein
MKKSEIFKKSASVAVAAFLVAGMTACEKKTVTTSDNLEPTGSKTVQGRTAGETLDDATITAKVKGALLADKGMSGFQVTVNTHLKEVQLSGFVDTEEQKKDAEKIAGTVEGVKSVKNDIRVKSKKSE